ncbi:hypothetical protein DM02DRAFT_636322 [Periconia macrospinosa]|uniref:Uncharacterized protein n=1 Tax=Periconia macrospinosa TaxID=97972 RepID=A0A2V1CZF3_9PLEO|nr:hypothetical protein DM02DRAFT_636322 [Periconia macrospinosa]
MDNCPAAQNGITSGPGIRARDDRCLNSALELNASLSVTDKSTNIGRPVVGVKHNIDHAESAKFEGSCDANTEHRVCEAEDASYHADCGERLRGEEGEASDSVGYHNRIARRIRGRQCGHMEEVAVKSTIATVVSYKLTAATAVFGGWFSNAMNISISAKENAAARGSRWPARVPCDLGSLRSAASNPRLQLGAGARHMGLIGSISLNQNHAAGRCWRQRVTIPCAAGFCLAPYAPDPEPGFATVHLEGGSQKDMSFLVHRPRTVTHWKLWISWG